MEPLTMHDYTAAYALDALDREESARYEEHLATCAECQEQLAQLPVTGVAPPCLVPAHQTADRPIGGGRSATG